ncbi:hypothetical protein [Kingella oralis]|nr:hypothetical protein [Kingella oralis]
MPSPFQAASAWQQHTLQSSRQPNSAAARRHRGNNPHNTPLSGKPPPRHH